LNKKKYIARVKRVKERESRMEELVLESLETGEVQAWPIVDFVTSQMGDVPQRMILRMIYKIMGIDVSEIPETREDDYYLL